MRVLYIAMVWNEANDHLGTLIVPPIQNLNEKAPFENSFTDTDSNDIAVFYMATMISEMDAQRTWVCSDVCHSLVSLSQSSVSIYT